MGIVNETFSSKNPRYQEMYNLKRETEFYEFILKTAKPPTKLRKYDPSSFEFLLERKKMKLTEKRNEAVMKVFRNLYQNNSKDLTQIQRDLETFSQEFQKSVEENKWNESLETAFREQMFEQSKCLDLLKCFGKRTFTRNEDQLKSIDSGACFVLENEKIVMDEKEEKEEEGEKEGESVVERSDQINTEHPMANHSSSPTKGHRISPAGLSQ